MKIEIINIDSNQFVEDSETFGTHCIGKLLVCPQTLEVYEFVESIENSDGFGTLDKVTNKRVVLCP